MADCKPRTIAAVRPDCVLTDRGSAADDPRGRIRSLGVDPQIPGQRSRRVPIDHDRVPYWEREWNAASAG